MPVSRPIWKIRIFPEITQKASQKGLTLSQIQTAVEAFRLLQFEPNVIADGRVLPIRETRNEWHRFRDDEACPGIRVIFHVNYYRRETAQESGFLGSLMVKAVLPKDDNTYQIAYEMWLNEP